MRAWIKDGLTRDADIQPKTAQGEAGEFPVVKIKYRPPLSDVLIRYLDADDLRGPDRAASLLAFLEQHLVEWNVEDEGGKNPKITAETLKRVPTEYLFEFRRELVDATRKMMLETKN